MNNIHVVCLLTVRNDGSAFLGAIAGFAALLLVFLLYLNKRWWWGAVSGLACCDEPCPSPPIRPPTPASGTASSVPVQAGTANKAHSKNKLGKGFFTFFIRRQSPIYSLAHSFVFSSS